MTTDSLPLPLSDLRVVICQAWGVASGLESIPPTVLQLDAPDGSARGSGNKPTYGRHFTECPRLSSPPVNVSPSSRSQDGWVRVLFRFRRSQPSDQVLNTTTRQASHPGSECPQPSGTQGLACSRTGLSAPAPRVSAYAACHVGSHAPLSPDRKSRPHAAHGCPTVSPRSRCRAE